MTPSGTSPPPRSPQGRVRWRRFAAIAVPSFAALGALFVLTAEGALGVSFAISGQAFTVTASQLKGNGFEQFGGIDKDASGNLHPVVVSAIRSASLSDLCQSVAFPLVGHLRISAGGGGNPATADSLVVDATALSGDASFTNINIGQDPTTFTEVPSVTVPAATKGTFGQQADSVTINNLNQTALATTAGTFTLPGLKLGFGNACP
jgi:Family of unknown function (DUF6230)